MLTACNSPFLSAEYKNVVLADSYIHLVEEALTGYASAASTGGLHYGISCDSMSLRISVSGFTEKLPSFYKVRHPVRRGPQVVLICHDFVAHTISAQESESHSGGFHAHARTVTEAHK